MGFAIKSPKMSTAAAAADSTPAIVTETVDDSTARAQDQKRARKRGLLSTILSTRNRGGALTSQNPTGNTTLG